MKDDLFRPMLATDADLTKLRFPLLASAKLDGVRAVVRDGVVYSRSNKPIPNKYVQNQFGHLEHFDGELIVGEPTSKTVYRDTVSHVMSHDKAGFDVRFHAFDHIGATNQPYKDRQGHLTPNHAIRVFVLEQVVINGNYDLEKLEAEYLDQGYEGLILRDPNAPYKRGRSTVKEGYLLKLKRFTDFDCKVIGFEERQHNGNAATTNELGRTKRSSHAAGKTGLGDLGALVVLSPDGIEFRVGTGFDDSERARVWGDRSSYLGKLAKIKYFAIGVKTAPRHPVFLGFRDGSDL